VLAEPFDSFIKGLPLRRREPVVVGAEVQIAAVEEADRIRRLT